MTPAVRSGRGRRWFLAAAAGLGVALTCGTGVHRIVPEARAEAASAAGGGRAGGGALERRIARLHAVLRITPAQEPSWTAFADAMRRNAGRADAAADAWRQRDRSGDAVGALQLYGRMEDADAENARQIVPPFQALYGTLSAAQKKTADALVARYVDEQAHRRP